MTLDTFTQTAHSTEYPDTLADDYDPFEDEPAAVPVDGVIVYRAADNVAADLDREPTAYELELMHRELEGEVSASMRQHRDSLRDRYCSSGHDIAENLSGPEVSIDEANHVYRMLGYNELTAGDDSRRKARVAAKERANSRNILTGKAAALGVKTTEPKPAKSKPEAAAGLLPGAPLTTNRATLEAWARDYCSKLAERYQSVKLTYALFGRPENPGGGSLAWQVSVMPLDDSKLGAWAQSAQLSFDKKVGA